MGKSSINGPFSMAMLNNQRVVYTVVGFRSIPNPSLKAVHGKPEIHKNRLKGWV
jgi:hypothetical protein